MHAGWLLVNSYYYPLKVLGPGVRIGVWTQGCTIRCKGCASVHTWEFDAKKRVFIEDFVKKLSLFPTRAVTVSGGEPFEQRYFEEFLKELRKKGFDDILVYSGFGYEEIKKRFKKCLKYIDVLVCEPFVEGLESEYSYKGSANQKAVILNRKIFKKYQKFLSEKKVSLQVTDKMIIGILPQKDAKILRSEDG